jgi:diadenosine tetraphosphatase ApaH/serine/threonine PP2A family protein phosphatase
VDGQFVAVHGSLHPRPNDLLRIRSEIEAEESLEALKRNFPGLRLCFFGHMHRPVAYEMSDGEVCEMPSKELELKPQAYYLINPGSVGQSRDEDPRAAYGVFDSERQSVQFRRVDYDRISADRKVGEAGLAVEPGVMWRSASWIKRGLARTVRRASLKIGR